jgi:hypothetical protein
MHLFAKGSGLARAFATIDAHGAEDGGKARDAAEVATLEGLAVEASLVLKLVNEFELGVIDEHEEFVQTIRIDHLVRKGVVEFLVTEPRPATP